MGVQDQLRQRLLHDGIKGNAAALGTVAPSAPAAARPQLPGPFVGGPPPGYRPGGNEAYGPGGVPLRPPVRPPVPPVPPAAPVDLWHDGIKGNAAAAAGGVGLPFPGPLPTDAPMVEPPAWPPPDVNEIRQTGGQMGLRRLLWLAGQQGQGPG